MARMQIFFRVPYACTLNMMIDGQYHLQFDSENFEAVNEWANKVVQDAAEQVNMQKRAKVPVTVRPRIGGAAHLPKPPQALSPTPIAAGIIAGPPVDTIIIDSAVEITDDLPVDEIAAAAHEAMEAMTAEQLSAEIDDIVAQACRKIPGGITVFINQAIMRKMSPEDLAQYIIDTPDELVAQELMLPVGNSGIKNQDSQPVSSA